MTFNDQTEEYRPDIVVYINGIPLVVIECKAPDRMAPIDEAITQLQRYQNYNSKLFWYSNLII